MQSATLVVPPPSGFQLFCQFLGPHHGWLCIVRLLTIDTEVVLGNFAMDIVHLMYGCTDAVQTLPFRELSLRDLLSQILGHAFLNGCESVPAPSKRSAWCRNVRSMAHQR